MARVTVEDCLHNVDNRFQLVLVAAKRARQLTMGKEPMVDWENDKATVVALREISAGLVDRSILEKEVEEEKKEETLEDLLAAADIDGDAAAATATESAAAGSAETVAISSDATTVVTSSDASLATPEMTSVVAGSEPVSALAAETEATETDIKPNMPVSTDDAPKSDVEPGNSIDDTPNI